MTQVNVKDFKFGMDRRRARPVGTPGSLWTLRNAHISRGGDIERMKKWVEQAYLPTGTFGLVSVFGQLVVFGSEDLAPQMPLMVSYQRLIAPNAPVMLALLDAQVYKDKIYAIARYNDGTIHHFYDGVRVADWDAIGAANVSASWVVLELATLATAHEPTLVMSNGRTVRVSARVPGVPFGANASGAGATVTVRQANVAEVPEVDAVATIAIVSGPTTFAASAVPNITSLVIDGHQMIYTPIPWDGNSTNMAVALVNVINEFGGIVPCRASSGGNLVTIHGGDGAGAALNGHTVVITTDASLVINTTNFSGGVTHVAPVAEIVDLDFPGVIDGTTQLAIQIDSELFVYHASSVNKGTKAMTYKQRMWCVAGTLLRYSFHKDPSKWDDLVADSTAGFIDFPVEGEGSERLHSLARYDQTVAVFATNQIRLWTLEVDPELNTPTQTLNNTGSQSPIGIVQYGDMDIFYLDTPGVRSLKARSGVTTAAVNDVGTALDTWLQELTARIERQSIAKAVGVIDPVDGRYILAIGDKMIVLSAFANTKIIAWSYYEPGFRCTWFARQRRAMYARDANRIYLYGGMFGDDYPGEGETPVYIETPFLTANEPGVFKDLNAFMAVCENEWNIDLLLDPNDNQAVIPVGIVHGTTFSEQFTPIEGTANMVALRMSCNRAGPATFSAFTLDFNKVK